MDGHSKIVHNVTKFIRVAIEERLVSIRIDTNGSTPPYFIILLRPNCRVFVSLHVYKMQCKKGLKNLRHNQLKSLKSYYSKRYILRFRSSSLKNGSVRSSMN